jgi:hypothetical protein
MEHEKDHKDLEKSYAPDANVRVAAADDYYDPSQESRMTRLGLTARSFTRAPGLTRYVASPFIWGVRRLSGFICPTTSASWHAEDGWVKNGLS